MRWSILILCFPFFFPAISRAENLQDKWQTLFQQSWQSSPLTVPQQVLSLFPTELMMDNSRYPDFNKVSWQDIELLAAIPLNCQPVTSENTNLSDSIAFELALCNGDILDTNWFSAHSLLHSAGGSFADRYLKQHPSMVKQIKNQLSLSNPLHPLYKTLSNLSPKGRHALLNGYRAWQEGSTLWLSGEQGWKAINSEKWQPIAEKIGISIQSDHCSLRYSNLCMSEPAEYQTLQRILTILLLVILISVFTRGFYLKRRQDEEKKFILQLLTHELRTPITSLSLTVEMFKEDYDSLPANAQNAVWRLIADYQRLSQLTENSKVYLSKDKSQQLLKQKASLEEWLSYICDKHHVAYQLEHDIELNQPYYWLSICLDNLIKNAKQHGKDNIFVNVKLTNKLIIEVKDAGNFPSPITLFFSRLKPKQNENNMGIGLGIVKHLMNKANGKLTILRHPTRCILELPYEHDITD